MQPSPNITGPEVPLPVCGRFPLVPGVVAPGVVVGTVLPWPCRVVVLPGLVVVVALVVTGGPSVMVDVGAMVVVGALDDVVGALVLVVVGAVEVVLLGGLEVVVDAVVLVDVPGLVVELELEVVP